MSNRAGSERGRHNCLTSEDIALALLFPDDGQAAQTHLDAGHPIYYCEDEYSDEMVRKWPDGHLELVTVTYDGSISHTRPYPAKGAIWPSGGVAAICDI